MKTFAATVLSLLLAACASTPTVHTDADPAAAFASYRTYKWIQSPQGVSPLLQQRIVDGVNQQLAAKGWSESADADVAIAAHVATEQRQDIDTFYSGPAYAGWGWHGPWAAGSVNTSVRTYDVGTLVVDLFDRRPVKPFGGERQKAPFPARRNGSMKACRRVSRKCSRNSHRAASPVGLHSNTGREGLLPPSVQPESRDLTKVGDPGEINEWRVV